MFLLRGKASGSTTAGMPRAPHNIGRPHGLRWACCKYRLGITRDKNTKKYTNTNTVYYTPTHSYWCKKAGCEYARQKNTQGSCPHKRKNENFRKPGRPNHLGEIFFREVKRPAHICLPSENKQFIFVNNHYIYYIFLRLSGIIFTRLLFIGCKPAKTGPV